MSAIASVRPHQESSARDTVAWDDPSWRQTIAGGSARAQFDKRRTRQRDRVARRRPLILAQAVGIAAAGLYASNGGFGAGWQPFGWLVAVFAVLFAVTRLFVMPSHVTAWETGADGEVRTSRALESLARDGFEAIHDRRMPGGRENIDHIVIGPPGVFVVETKNYSGALRVRGGELYVAGRRRVGVLDQVTRQADAVGQALGGIPVARMIVVHRAEFPFFGRPTLSGVPIVGPDRLVQYLRKQPAIFDQTDIDRLAHLAMANLRPAQ